MSLNALVLEGLRGVLKPTWRANVAAELLSSLVKAVGPRRDVADNNLKMIFPHLTSDQRRSLINASYKHLVWSMVEFLCLVDEPERALRWVVDVDGEEYLEEHKRQGKGIVMLTGHIGNWELLAAWLVCRGYPLVAIVRKPDDNGVAGLLDKYRTRLGVETIPKGKFLMRQAVHKIQEGAFVGFLADQAGSENELKLPFMGKLCYTVGGPAALSLLTGVQVVPVAMYRLKPFCHKVIVDAPLTPRCDLPRNQAISVMTEQANAILEGMILRHPEQWLWFHRRWRLKGTSNVDS